MPVSIYIVKVERTITTLIEVRALTAKAAMNEIACYGTDLAAVDFAKQDDEVTSKIVSAKKKL